MLLKMQKKNFSSASEKKKQGDTCAAQEAFTLFTNTFNCRMTGELKNEPLTHSCKMSQRVQSIEKEQKEERKGAQIPPQFPAVVLFQRLCEHCVDGGDDAWLDACGAFPPVCHVSAVTTEWQKRMLDGRLLGG